MMPLTLLILTTYTCCLTFIQGNLYRTSSFELGEIFIQGIIYFLQNFKINIILLIV